jgi:hypothetical protein
VTYWTWLITLAGIGFTIGLQRLSREHESRSAAIKRLLLTHSAGLLVPREGERPRVVHPTTDGREKYSAWQQRKAIVDARRKARGAA